MWTTTVKLPVICCVCLWISDESAGGGEAHLQLLSEETPSIKDQHKQNTSAVWRSSSSSAVTAAPSLAPHGLQTQPKVAT